MAAMGHLFFQTTTSDRKNHQKSENYTILLMNVDFFRSLKLKKNPPVWVGQGHH